MKINIRAFSLLILLSTNLFAQGDLQIFGFFQSRFQKTNQEVKLTGFIPTQVGVVETTLEDSKQDYSSPDVQQLNLFFKKDLGHSLTSWINLEFTNSFSSSNGWGYLNLEEAWMNYEHSDFLKIKAGWIIPTFNFMNTIKNRMPLLPYIIRPLAYESTLGEIFDLSDFVPEKAFLQIEGDYYWKDFGLHYSVFAGPSESSYFTSSLFSQSERRVSGGTDTTNFKLFGGRLGFDYRNLRLGVSATIDKDNHQETLGEDVSRTRVGFDLGVSKFGFFFEGEYIFVSLDSDKSDAEMDKTFYFATLGYDFNDNLFAYASYSSLKDEESPLLKPGFNSLLFGLGYRVSYPVVLKAQYGTYYSDGDLEMQISPELPPINAKSNIDVNYFGLAVSVLF